MKQVFFNDTFVFEVVTCEMRCAWHNWVVTPCNIVFYIADIKAAKFVNTYLKSEGVHRCGYICTDGFYTVFRWQSGLNSSKYQSNTEKNDTGINLSLRHRNYLNKRCYTRPKKLRNISSVFLKHPFSIRVDFKGL